MASLPSPTQVAKNQYGIFDSWFRKLDSKNSGGIQAGSAAQLLKKSGLNDNVLSRIWDLSDPGGKGYLDKTGFFVALKLVALVQNGKEPILSNINFMTPPPNLGEPPPHPPPPSAKSPGPPPVPALPAHIPENSSSLEVWTITPTDRIRYDQIFNSLGPEANKIHGNKVRGVMLNSKLPMDILGKIWDHADMDKDGSLDRVEFSIAMHLIYKVLENNPLPTSLPQEMLSSARRAGVAAQGPVPAPLAPPSQNQIIDNNKLQNTGPPPAPWVVTAADKARYDIMFHNADLDKDGFVSGQEIKGIFLQSGLPQMVLAHIWNLCDMKQTGKLTSEQFALAMWLVQQKIAGMDPPSALTTDMIPPTMRPKPSADAAPVVAKPTYTNPELQAVADEIDEVGKDRLKLESDIQQKEASIRLKNNETKNLQTELDTLTATLRQLENQKGAAQKRLDDLAQQKTEQESLLSDLEEQFRYEDVEVETLRVQVEEQETSLKAQEDEVMSKQKELNDLRTQEMELEASVISTRKKMEKLSATQQDTQLFISQAKNKIEELDEQEKHMTGALRSYDTVISSSDASSVPESLLMDVNPTFNDVDYMTVGPVSPKAPETPLESPKNPIPETNGLPEPAEIAVPKGKDTSFIDGHDPFAQAFGGGHNPSDPFASWEASKKPAYPAAAVSVDPFGGDSFAAKGKTDAFGTEPFAANKDVTKSESPTPALPPKKPKQAPPRPAPPRTRPAKPPPPQINSNNNPATTNDPFSGGWNDNPKTNPTKSDGFADFANFANFDSKYSSATSSSFKSPWGGENSRNSSKKDPFGNPLKQLVANTHSRNERRDPFDDAFRNSKNTSYSPWPVNSPSSGFGSQNGSDNLFESTIEHFGSDNPFGGDYDPFKDSTGIREADEFSWDEEAEGAFTDSISDGSFAPNLDGKQDPFCLSSDDSPENRRWNVGAGDSKKNTLSPSNNNLRSKSALGDPLEQFKRSIPVRSKTSLGNPGLMELDFDPLSKVTTTDLPWKSNEDLLNENIFTAAPTPSANTINSNQGWGDTGVKNPQISNSISKSTVTSFASFDNNRLVTHSSSWLEEQRRKNLDEREKADLELAIALSRSLHEQTSTNKSKAIRSSRSPSTGL